MPSVALSLYVKQKPFSNSLALTLSRDILKEKSFETVTSFLSSEYMNNNQFTSEPEIYFHLNLYHLAIGGFLVWL